MRLLVEDLADTADPDAMRLVRRARRRLVHKQQLLTMPQLCRRMGISRTRLRMLEMRGYLFRVVHARTSYYPRFFVCRDRVQSRVARLSRAMGPMEDGWGKHFELNYRFESLGNRTLLQAIRRASGFRAAKRYAHALAGDRCLS
jgi:hypothetical protein